jgi:hypothetical protein
MRCINPLEIEGFDSGDVGHVHDAGTGEDVKGVGAERDKFLSDLADPMDVDEAEYDPAAPDDAAEEEGSHDGFAGFDLMDAILNNKISVNDLNDTISVGGGSDTLDDILRIIEKEEGSEAVPEAEQPMLEVGQPEAEASPARRRTRGRPRAVRSPELIVAAPR